MAALTAAPMQALSQSQAQAPAAAPAPSAKKYQARAPTTQSLGAEAFERREATTLRWLGMAGFPINSRGTTIMVDPLLKEFDIPLLIEMPITDTAVPRLDAVLVTHSDNDHYSVSTCRGLKPVARIRLGFGFGAVTSAVSKRDQWLRATPTRRDSTTSGM